MKNYPEAQKYGDWIEEYIFELPSNLLLKVLYFPFYLAGSFFVFFTDGFGLIVFYIIFLPVYGFYLIYYHLRKHNFFSKKLIVVIDKDNSKVTKLKDVVNPTKDGFEFLHWEYENEVKVLDIWKLSAGTKIFARWKNKILEAPKPNDAFVDSGFHLKLSGVSIGNRQKNINTIKVNDELVYVREPRNPYDKNAILIKTKDGLELGYIPKENNTKLAENIDKGLKYKIIVATISGSGTQYRGVNVQIIQENQTSNGLQPNLQTTSQRIPKSTFVSMDFDSSDSLFFNDDFSSSDSSFVDSDNDGGNEPEVLIEDFDGDGSDF